MLIAIGIASVQHQKSPDITTIKGILPEYCWQAPPARSRLFDSATYQLNALRRAVT